MRPIRFSVTLMVLASLGARADMIHRWSFNNPTGTAPSGTAMSDTISGAVATVRSGTAAGNLATFTGTGLTLPGATNGNQAPANISAYVDLPNGIVSSKTNLTIEIWATPVSVKSWQRLFDIGRTNLTGNTAAQGAGAAAGEILHTATVAPGGTESSDNFMLAIHRGTATNTQRFSARLDGAPELLADTSRTINSGTQYHFVATFTDGAGTYGAGGGQIAWYHNGAKAATIDVNFHLRDIEDVNNWLGRSQYSGDSNSHITYNEVRLYDHAMTAVEISESGSAGPDPAFQAPGAVADAVTMHHGTKARIPVLENDTGVLSGPTVTILQPPSFGTAVPDGTGNVLYSHTSGTPAGDSFTYQVTGPGGTSSPATVSITFADTLRITPAGLNIPSTPPPLAIQLTTAVTGLNNPLCIATPPGETQRVFVCQKGGLLRVIDNLSAPTPAVTTFLDLPAVLTPRGESISANGEQGLLGLAFHPDYATNRHFYLFYSVNIGSSVYERVSRFTTQSGNPNLADTTSELVLIQQLDQASNHNGGDLHFGPDGYLYISLGDEGDQNDSLNNSQTITKDFFAAIARIDVDKKPGNPAPNPHAAIPTDGGVARYSVPADNPYVGATTFNGSAVTPANVRTEFWAVGFRNPWRMHFDSETDELWAGDVGQGVYEEIDIVLPGGNYGWAFREGAHNGPKSAQAPANFDTLYHTPPLYEYVHTGVAGGDSNFKGNSVTGGVVYRGTRYPSLTGAYIFADYVSGHIWSLVRNGQNPPIVARIAGETGIVAFGRDPSNDDVLLADFDGGRLLRLTVDTPSGTYPQTLSETGLFADLTDLSPAPGVLPYAVNLPFWSDFAVKSRWFAIPDSATTMTWSHDGAWTFPDGQIWIKHFDMEMTRGNPATKKRLETRVLVKNAGGAYGVSYRWNDAGTEATLVADGGADFDLEILENNTPHIQQWRIPSRAECMACHTPQAGHALSFTTRQINLPADIHGFSGNQIALLRDAGYFANDPGSTHLLPRHLRPDETGYPSEARVRSYLDVNCAYCHRAGGTAAPAAWDGRHELTLDQTGLIHGAASNNGGDPANKLVVPGDTARSIVLNRVAATNGFTRMPPLATTETDPTNIALLTEWIADDLPERQTYDQWRLARFGSSDSPEGERGADPDGDGSTNGSEFLALTDPLLGSSFPTVRISTGEDNILLEFNAPPNRSAWIETSADLFNWSLWDVSGNNGLPLPGGPAGIGGPLSDPERFFRLRWKEN